MILVRGPRLGTGTEEEAQAQGPTEGARPCKSAIPQAPCSAPQAPPVKGTAGPPTAWPTLNPTMVCILTAMSSPGWRGSEPHHRL